MEGSGYPVFDLINRFDFQRMFARGVILNVGCFDDPAKLWRDFNAVNFDINDLSDWYSHDFIKGDACNLPFPSRCFDAVVLGDILEHLEEYEKAVSEACRVGDRVIMTIPSEEHDQNFAQHAKEYNFPNVDNKYLEHVNQFDDNDITDIIAICQRFHVRIRVNLKVKLPFWCGWLIVADHDDTII